MMHDQNTTINKGDGIVEEVGHKNPVDNGCTEVHDNGECYPHVLAPASQPVPTHVREIHTLLLS